MDLNSGVLDQHQWILPRVRKKWLWQPLDRQIDGLTVARPRQSRSRLQRGDLSPTKRSVKRSPHPQGQAMKPCSGDETRPVT